MVQFEADLDLTPYIIRQNTYIPSRSMGDICKCKQYFGLFIKGFCNRGVACSLLKLGSLEKTVIGSLFHSGTIFLWKKRCHMSFYGSTVYTMSFFCQKKDISCRSLIWHMTSFFPQKMVPECKPEWNREAITVFSRLPSLRRLQATPLLQTSLPERKSCN